MPKKDGGPAFPMTFGVDSCEPGMTMRQAYKIAALQGMAQHLTGQQKSDLANGIKGRMIEAKAAGQLADSMIEEDEAAAKWQPAGQATTDEEGPKP